MSTDTTVTVNPAMNKVVDLLEQFAEKMGVTGTEIWNLMVSQANVQVGIIVSYLVIGIITACIIPPLWIHAVKLNDTDSASHSHVVTVILCAVMCVITLICIIAFMSHIGALITCIMNPEYWAFTQLMSKL